MFKTYQFSGYVPRSLLRGAGWSFGHWVLGIRSCFGFRDSNFGCSALLFAVLLLGVSSVQGQERGSPSQATSSYHQVNQSNQAGETSQSQARQAYSPNGAVWKQTAGGPAGSVYEAPVQLQPPSPADFLSGGVEDWTSPGGLTSSLQILLLLTVLTLAPAILLMTTSFVRIVVVLGLLRQALGAQNLPPTQVITSIALFMTVLIMAPVWSEVYNDAIVPYTDEQMDLKEAWSRAEKPIKRFMGRQIKSAGNKEDVWLFFHRLPEEDRVHPPANYDEVPLRVLLPAFMLSELKIAFLIGFNIYLPFLILDVVVSSVTISMNMVMLPPTIVSLPFKLLLFVLVDGWRLVVGMLLESFAPYV